MMACGVIIQSSHPTGLGWLLQIRIKGEKMDLKENNQTVSYDDIISGKAEVKRKYRAWLSADAPNGIKNCSVLGIDFPYTTKEYRKDKKGRKIKPGFDIRGHIVEITDEHYQTIIEKLAEPVEYDAVIKSVKKGKCFHTGLEEHGYPIPMGPIGKYLHLDPVDVDEATDAKKLPENEAKIIKLQARLSEYMEKMYAAESENDRKKVEIEVKKIVTKIKNLKEEN